MPDAPDDYQVSQISQYPSLGDMGELAARLNPAMVLAREGMTLFYTDFTRGWAGLTNPTNDVDNFTWLYPSSYSMSGLEAYLYTERDYDNEFGVVARQPIIEGQFFIFDTQIVCAQGHGGYELTGSIGLNGVSVSIAYIYTIIPRTLSIRDSSGDLIDITSRFPRIGALTTIHHVSLKVDMLNKCYHSITFNSDTVSLIDIGAYNFELANVSDMIQIGLFTFTDNSTYCVLEIQRLALAVSNIP